MNEVPSDSNAFSIWRAFKRRLGWGKSREVISSVTIKNDDRALCVSLPTPLCASVHGYNERRAEKRRLESQDSHPGVIASAPRCIAGDYWLLYRDHVPPGPRRPPRRSALVHSVTQCTCSADTRRVTCTYVLKHTRSSTSYCPSSKWRFKGMRPKRVVFSKLIRYIYLKCL